MKHHPRLDTSSTNLAQPNLTYSYSHSQFRIDDIDKPWVFSQSLDLTHSRVCSGVAIRSLPDYLAQAYQHLRPGGWVEAQEFDLKPLSDDNSFPPDSQIIEWHELFHAGMLAGGCNTPISVQEMRRFMEEAGFVNV
jgi:hypothetical protein